METPSERLQKKRAKRAAKAYVRAMNKTTKSQPKVLRRVDFVSRREALAYARSMLRGKWRDRA